MSSPTVDAIMTKSSYAVGDIEDSAEEVDIEIPVTFKKRKKNGESSTGGQEKSKAKGGKAKKYREDKQWSDDEKMHLIRLWEDEACLYDASSKDYHKKDKKTAAEERILDMMRNKYKLTEEDLIMKDIKGQMKNLRTYYNHQRRCEMDSVRSGSGVDDVTKSTWKFYPFLKFLEPNVTPMETESNLKKRQDISDDEEEDEFFTQTQKKTPIRRQLKTKPKTSPTEEVLLKCSNALSNFSQKADLGKSQSREDREDPDYLFGKVMEKCAREIEDPMMKELAKLEAQQLFFRYRFQQSSQQPYQQSLLYQQSPQQLFPHQPYHQQNPYPQTLQMPNLQYTTQTHQNVSYNAMSPSPTISSNNNANVIEDATRLGASNQPQQFLPLDMLPK